MYLRQHLYSILWLLKKIYKSVLKQSYPLILTTQREHTHVFYVKVIICSLLSFRIHVFLSFIKHKYRCLAKCLSFPYIMKMKGYKSLKMTSAMKVAHTTCSLYIIISHLNNVWKLCVRNVLKYKLLKCTTLQKLIFYTIQLKGIPHTFIRYNIYFISHFVST